MSSRAVDPNAADRHRELESALRDPMLVDRPVEDLQKFAKRLVKSPEISQRLPRSTRIAMNGGFMTSFLAELLPLFLAQRGIAAELREGSYGGLHTEILDETSDFWRFAPDLVLLLPTHRDLRHLPVPGTDAAECRSCVMREVADWQRLWDRLMKPVLQLSFDPPPTRALADADGLFPGGLLNHVRRVNLAMAEAAPPYVAFVDAEWLIAQVGAALWHDERLYRLAKQPFAMGAIPAVANALAAATAAISGAARKVLILDLDNTLWGGVIGDDGIEGIVLGPETPEGEAYVAFQHYVKSLGARGIVLAVCSKNAPDVAREPFGKHGAMVLQLDDIACFVANFDDKAQNVRLISRTLNLGLESCVFVDDSPVECALVRAELPEVWTIELGQEPYSFARTIERALPFPVYRLTEEDRRRSESYRALGMVQSTIEGATDIDSFLRDLEPEVVVETVRDDTVERFSQLIAKTNQFKLNPSAFSPAELRARAADVIGLRLRDRLQDYGIVAVAVMEVERDALVVRNWVMSCRVFSRRLEFLMRELLAERAQGAGLSRLRLEYRESGRNGLIREILPVLGFALARTDGHYEAPAEAPVGMPAHFVRLGAALPEAEFECQEASA